MDTGELAWYEWGERDHSTGAPTLLMLHATGFHAQCWRQVIAALPKDQHVICVDLRGYGASSKKLEGGWDQICDDLERFVRALGLNNLIGVGHSMGGYVIFSLACVLDSRFRGAILIDPVILDPMRYKSPNLYGADAATHPTARRRNQWRGWREMYKNFRGRHPFSLWDQRVLRDYCQYGLVRRADAKSAEVERAGVTGVNYYELACPPLVEASIYVNSATRSPHHLFPLMTVPTWVVRGYERDFEAVARSGRFDFSASPTWPELASRLPNGRDIHWKELSHFIPMQAPERVAALISAFLRDVVP